MKEPMTMRDPENLARRWLQALMRYLDHEVSCCCAGCEEIEARIKKMGKPPGIGPGMSHP